MAFSATTSKVATKKLIKVIETKVVGKGALTNDSIIDKTLNGEGLVVLVSEDKVGENLMISGEVRLDGMFLTAEKTIDSAPIKCEFSERLTLGDVDYVVCVPKIKNIKLVKENDKILSAAVLVETKIYGIEEESNNILSGEEDGFYTSLAPVRTSSIVASTNTSFVVNETIDIDLLSSKILNVGAVSALSKVTPFDNYVLVEGSTTVDFLVAVDEQVKKLTKVVDFSEEIAALNVSPDNIVDCLLFNKNVSYNQNVEESGVSVEIEVGVGVWAFTQAEIQVVKDAFSDRKNVSLTYSNISNVDVYESKVFSERKNIVIEQGLKRIDEVLFVGQPLATITGVVNSEGFVFVDGVFNVPVVYKNYDSDEISISNFSEQYQLNIPFVEKEGENSIDVNMSAKINSYKNKAGKDISFLVDFEGVVSSTFSKTEQCVVEINETGEIPASKNAIIVMKPNKGESVFEIAKKLQISPDVLRAQNPNIDDDKEIGQVVVFKKLK